MPRMKTLLIVIAGSVLALYAAGMTWLWFQQEKLLFQPTVLPADYVLSRHSDVREVTVAVPGAQLSGLHLQTPGAKGVVFFLHGNGGDVSTWFIDPEFYRQARMDVVMIDYRGYGKSTGAISSEAQLRSDVRAVWQHFAPQYADKKVVLLGRSLGTALAAGLSVELAEQGKPPDATLLISAYQSMLQMATQHYPIVPHALVRYRLHTDQAVSRIRSPLWLIHGEQDELIPHAHSLALHKLAPQARLVLIPGAGHNNLQMFDSYLKAVRAVLDSV